MNIYNILNINGTESNKEVKQGISWQCISWQGISWQGISRQGISISSSRS